MDETTQKELKKIKSEQNMATLVLFFKSKQVYNTELCCFSVIKCFNNVKNLSYEQQNTGEDCF